MTKIITTLSVAILMMATITNATVWRVNNRPNVNADFTTLQDAIDGASSGDTLYIEGSTTSYGDGVFGKQLTVIGTGYWLAENDTTQAYKEHSQVGRLTFNTGCEGSTIEGLYIYYSHNTNFSLIAINVDSITIRRNYIYPYKTHYGSEAGIGIRISADISNFVLSQNWVNARVHSSYFNNSDIIYGVYFDGIPINSNITNNFIRAYRTSNTGSFVSIYMATNNTANELIINNNVIWGNITTYYSIHVNNILIEGSYNNGTGDLTSYNLCDGTQYPDANGNQQNIDMSTVFVDYIKYIDNGYLLAPGSTAIGAGINGGDCGAFGNGSGGDPYILSGMPEIPAVFDATVTPIGTDVLPVNIKATSHN